MRSEVKVEKLVLWLKILLPQMTWEKGMDPLMDGDNTWKSGGIVGGS